MLSSAEETILRLQTENVLLRERLALFEAAEETSKRIASELVSVDKSSSAQLHVDDDFTVAVADALPTALRFKKSDLEHYDELLIRTVLTSPRPRTTRALSA